MIRTITIDIVGGCNLRCPTCPVGNSDYASVPKGYMKPELLEQIVDKAAKEVEGTLYFALYNWTEPFLHPNLAQMVRIITSRGYFTSLSTNGNILRDEDAVLAAEPTLLRVSVSGFEQEKYSKTHARGDIKKVKDTMRRLAAAKTRTASSTKLEVIFHRYLDNGPDEVEMRVFAKELGFAFMTVWAYMMPVEKVIEYRDRKGRTSITKQDEAVLERLALPLDKALTISAEKSSKGCPLLDKDISITVTGDALLCCGTFDPIKYGAGSFVDQSFKETQAKRRANSLCGDCVKTGAKALATYEAGPALDKLALDTIKERRPELADLPIYATLSEKHPTFLRRVRSVLPFLKERSQ